VTLLLGVRRLAHHDHRREIVIALLALVWVFNVLGVVVLVASLVAHSAIHITGAQLLASGGGVRFTNSIAFGLAFWEPDCGGPVARALATTTRRPDFQFPQDENPQLARDGWAPRLWDYFYISLTNATAFSPTDSMPLTRSAKALMAAESTLSVVTVLLVAARAVNILVQSATPVAGRRSLGASWTRLRRPWEPLAGHHGADAARSITIGLGPLLSIGA
jgi:uncharacterized membrane protein